jgi:hypothetical protein
MMPPVAVSAQAARRARVMEMIALVMAIAYKRSGKKEGPIGPSWRRS